MIALLVLYGLGAMFTAGYTIGTGRADEEAVIRDPVSVSAAALGWPLVWSAILVLLILDGFGFGDRDA